MYITAHRVRDADGQEAIHGFRHRHDAERCPFPDDPLDVPERAPGILEKQETSLRVGGNRVISYLDLIAPEGTNTGDWRERLPVLFDRRGADALPVVIRKGPLVVIFWATGEIKRPVEEYRLLVQAALRLLA